jgi:hypothetical protein
VPQLPQTLSALIFSGQTSLKNRPDHHCWIRIVIHPQLVVQNTQHRPQDRQSWESEPNPPNRSAKTAKPDLNIDSDSQ